MTSPAKPEPHFKKPDTVRRVQAEPLRVSPQSQSPPVDKQKLIKTIRKYYGKQKKKGGFQMGHRPKNTFQMGQKGNRNTNNPKRRIPPSTRNPNPPSQGHFYENPNWGQGRNPDVPTGDRRANRRARNPFGL